MNIVRMFFCTALLLLSFMTASVSATPFSNPDPTWLGDDIDGSGIFLPNEHTFALKMLDLSEFISSVGGGFWILF